jgi:putative transposase
MKKSLAHSVWECKYHIVWVPKNRRQIIYGKLRKEIGAILRRLCQYKGVDVIEGNACIDHIHVCLSIPPKYSGIDDCGLFKG